MSPTTSEECAKTIPDGCRTSKCIGSQRSRGLHSLCALVRTAAKSSDGNSLMNDQCIDGVVLLYGIDWPPFHCFRMKLISRCQDSPPEVASDS